MRITNSMAVHNALAGIRQGMSALDEAQRQASSGLKLTRASDDPASAADVLGTDRRLSALAQYQRNISAAGARLGAQESTLDQLGSILTRARELATGQIGSTASAGTRETAAAEVTQLLDAALQLANTSFGSGYLFGGAYADAAPLSGGTPDPLRPPAGEPRIEVAAGQTMATALDGQKVFIDTEAVTGLRELAVALGASDGTAIAAAATKVTRAFDRTQVLVGEVGARTQQLELARSNAESLELGLREYRADLTEVEMEEAVSNLLARQTALQTAMLATSKLMSTTLTDYLR